MSKTFTLVLIVIGVYILIIVGNNTSGKKNNTSAKKTETKENKTQNKHGLKTDIGYR